MYTYCNPIITVVKIFATYLLVSFGRIAAGDVLDTVLQACVGPVYNKGVPGVYGKECGCECRVGFYKNIILLEKKLNISSNLHILV